MIKIFEHFWLKLFALIIGFVLWLHVATEKIYKYELLLPVTQVMLDKDLTLAQNPPDSVMVVVAATGKQLLRQKWRERGLRITATQFKTGRYQLKLTTSNTYLEAPSSLVALEEIVYPTNMILDVDRRSQVKVKVKPTVVSEPDEGFAVGDITRPEPAEVTVSGPHSVINKLKEISTEPRELKGLRNNVRLKLALDRPAGYGITIAPDSVALEVEIVPVKTRVFEKIPIVIYNAPVDKSVVANPAEIRVELTGSPADIDLLNKNALIASVDFKQTDAAGRTPIKIDCPSRFKVKSASTDSVTIRLK